MNINGFDVTLTSKHGQSKWLAEPQGVRDVLYEIGTEYRTADQFHDSEVVITIRPSTFAAEQERAKFDQALADIIDIGDRARSEV